MMMSTRVVIAMSNKAKPNRKIGSLERVGWTGGASSFALAPPASSSGNGSEGDCAMTRVYSLGPDERGRAATGGVTSGGGTRGAKGGAATVGEGPDASDAGGASEDSLSR